MKKRYLLAIAVLISILPLLAHIENKAYVVPVMMYHAIDHRDKLTKLSVSPEGFARQMEFLHRHKYNVISLEEAARYLKENKRPPRKSVAITFDDGFYNNYEHAYPVLKKYGFPATIFVIVDKVGQEGYLDWEAIREMSDSGLITIGSHTMSHLWLPAMGTKSLREELSRSKSVLEERLGKPVTTLCYPIGAFDHRVSREAHLAGYECAVATNPGRRYAENDIFAIRRIKISRTSDNLFVFWLETSGYYTWVKERGDIRDYQVP